MKKRPGLAHFFKKNNVFSLPMTTFCYKIEQFTTYVMRCGRMSIMGPWWWSSGLRARLLLRQFEFESR